jgi:hypothetical protein
VGLGGQWQNAAMVLGFETTNGYNPLRIGPYDRLVSPGESPWTASHRKFPASFPGYDCSLARLLGLEYVVLDRPIDQLPHLSRMTNAETLMAGPATWIYRFPEAAPRVTLNPRVMVADAEELIEAGKFPGTIGPADVMIDADEELTQKYSATAPVDAGVAQITVWRPDFIEIRVNARAQAIVTLHDPWYPGWEVEVDGERRPVLRADLLFRGVKTPPGEHRITFTYRPFSRENLVAAAREALGLED